MPALPATHGLIPTGSVSVPDEVPKPTTTISAIAVKIGDTVRIVLALLKSKNWCEIRIAHMNPSMLDIGCNLEEAKHFQVLHEQLVQKLASKQDQIEELLSQADGLVAQQTTPADADVYAAMADSLGIAWKDLNQQLQLRALVLDETVQFFTWSKRHNSDLDNLELACDANVSREKYENLRKVVQEGAAHFLGLGQSIMEHLRELGHLADNTERPKETADACARIETFMLSLTERRERILERWEQRLHEQYSRTTLPRTQEQPRSQQYKDLLTQYMELHTWLLNSVEAFLLSNRNMGYSEASAFEFFEAHKKVSKELESRMPSMKALYSGGREASKDLEYADIWEKIQELQEKWSRLSKAVQTRIDLCLLYQQFHRLATEMSSDLDSVDTMLRTANVADQETRKRLEDKWHALHKTFQNLKHVATKFVEDTKNVTGDPGFDIKHPIKCIEDTLEELRRRLAAITIKWEEYLTRQLHDKDLHDRWIALITAIKETTVQMTKILDEVGLAFSNFDDPPLQVLLRQRALQEQIQLNSANMQRETDEHFKQLQILSDKGSMPAKEIQNIVTQISDGRMHFEMRLSQFQQLIVKTISFFEKLYAVDERISDAEYSFQKLFASDNMDVIKKGLDNQQAKMDGIIEKLRILRKEALEAVQQVREEGHPAAVKREVEKMPRLVDKRLTQWEAKWTEQLTQLRSRLREHEIVTTFETQFRELWNHIDHLEQRYTVIVEQAGSGPDGASAAQSSIDNLISDIHTTDVRIKKFTEYTEQLLQGPAKGNFDVQRKLQDLLTKWSLFKAKFDSLEVTITSYSRFFSIMEEIEMWFNRTTEIVHDMDRKALQIKTSREATDMLDKMDRELKPSQREQEHRIEKLEVIARSVYGEEHWEHKVGNVKRRYREIVDSFQRIRSDLMALESRLRASEKQELIEFEETRIREERLRLESLKRLEAVESPMIPPKFTKPLLAAEATEGSRFTFPAHVTGHPTPEIEWYKDGLSIAGNTDYKTSFENGVCTLTIEETLAADAAMFMCKATNKAGTASSEANLIVRDDHLLHMQPPEFTKKLVSQNVTEGDVCTFVAHVIGNPVPDISWFKDDMCIDSVRTYNITYNNGVCSLTIREVSLSDDARFGCRAVNPAGEAVTSAKLSVTAAIPCQPPIFMAPLRNADVYAGEKVVLETRVRGDPEPEILWRHNNRPIRDSRDYKIYYDGYIASLTLTEAYPNNSGSYSVHAKNKAGEASSSCNVTVRTKIPDTSDSDVETGKPRFLQELRNIIVTEGDSARLDCVIIGNPEPEVIWYIEDRPVKESANRRLYFEGDRCSLVIPASRLEDAALYKCVARNQHGETTSFCKLTVLAKPLPPKIVGSPPKFIENLESQVIEEGTRVVFEARATGEPSPGISWYRNGEELRQNQNVSIQSDTTGWLQLCIHRATIDDSGVYMVIANNDSGEAKSICRLQVNVPQPVITEMTKSIHEHEFIQTTHNTPPEIVKHLPDVSALHGDTVTMEAVVIGNPKPKITWHFNGVTTEPRHARYTSVGDSYIVTISSLSPHNAGEYRLVAENTAGKAETFGKLSTAEEPKRSLDIDTTRTEHRVVTIQEGPTEVYIPPKFVKTLVSVVVVEGQPATFDGIVTGTPVPEMSWQKDGVDYIDTRALISYHNGKVRLHIENTKLNDTGKFVCSARNAGGLATSAAQLIVRPVIAAPDFKQRLVSKEVEEGSLLEWRVQVVGDPEPQVTWYRQNEIIKNCPEVQIIKEGNGVHCLKIMKAEIVDTGQFTARAENEGGEARSTADLVVRRKGQEAGGYVHVTKIFQEQQEAGMEVSAHTFYTGSK